MAPDRLWVRNPRSLRFKSLALTMGALAAPIVVLSSVYGVREHTLSTALMLLPVGVLIAWWTGRRMVRPLEALRAQVLLRASAAVPRAGLSLGRRDEFGDLSDAFDSLLQALEKRAKATEAFVADVAHELKNPIAALRASAEVLASTPIDTEKAQRLARVMQASCARLDQRVSELLEIARAEAGLTGDAREPCDVVALVNGMIEALRQDPRYAQRVFRVEASGPIGVPLALARFEAALRNVLENAASFGSVTVTITSDAAGCTIEVGDDGPGIAPENLPRVFDRFFTTREQAGGTGLGLALTRAIIEAHGGSIRVTSPAIFTIWLPFTEFSHTFL